MHEFHQKICETKDIFIKHSYSEQFVDKCVKTFLSKLVIPGGIIHIAKKLSDHCFTLYGDYLD